MDVCLLTKSRNVADTGDVGNGTLRHGSTYYAGRATRAAIARNVKPRRPSRLRVAATLTADAVAPVAVSLLAGRSSRGRAALWIQRAGLEWVFRLVRAPWHLWRRYMSSRC